MISYLENIEVAPILVLEEEINYNYPFVLIDLIEDNGLLKIKVRYQDKNPNLVKEKYFILKNLYKNNILLIINTPLNNIHKNINNTHKAIIDFYYNDIKVIQL